jgi:hypothetical protein
MPHVTYSEPTLTVLAEELPGSPVEFYDNEIGASVFQATRRLVCAWSDRFKLMTEYGGSVSFTGGTAGSTLTVTRPHLYPWSTDANLGTDFDVRVKRIELEPFSPKVESETAGVVARVAAPKAKYDHVLAVVTYSSEVQSFITQSFEAASEHLIIPPEQLYWDVAKTEPIKAEEAPGFRFEIMEWVVNEFVVPISYLQVLGDDIAAAPGKVNSVAIKSGVLDRIFPIETLLMQPVDINVNPLPSGGLGYSATFRMAYREDGWNKFWRLDDTGIGAWAVMYDGSGNQINPFQTVDFLSILPHTDSVV